jgi:hypothetical protein
VASDPTGRVLSAKAATSTVKRASDASTTQGICALPTDRTASARPRSTRT